MRSTPSILASLLLLALPGALLACADPDAPRDLDLDLDLPTPRAALAPGQAVAAPPAFAEPQARRRAGRDRYPASHPSMPQIPKNGGAVLHDPSIVTVTFPDDPLEDKIHAFADQIGSFAWWSTVHADYGVGPATNGGHVTIDAAPPAVIKDSQVERWIADRIGDGTLPAPTDQTIYTLYYPAATSVRFDASEGGGASCQVFLGYHSAFPVSYAGKSALVAYAVVNRCGDLDLLTVTASHELTEASTDPHPIDNGTAGYITLDDNAWTALGGEDADMCADVGAASEGGFSLTRVWSNSAAEAGDQPCLPAPDGAGAPFFDAGIVNERLVGRPGTSVSTEVDCYAFGALPNPMKLSAHAANVPSPLKLSFDRSTCDDGDKVTLTIAVGASAARRADYDYTLFADLDDKRGHLWRGMVHVE